MPAGEITGSVVENVLKRVNAIVDIMRRDAGTPTQMVWILALMIVTADQVEALPAEQRPHIKEALQYVSAKLRRGAMVLPPTT